MTIPTACSSSLSGLHIACQSLNSGDCSTAMVLGSSLIMDPSMTLDMSALGILAPDGRCKTFGTRGTYIGSVSKARFMTD